MRKPWILLWCLVPVGAVAWHFGPGQRWLAADVAGEALQRAQAAEAAGDWESAAAGYGAALESLPVGNALTRERLQLAEARAAVRSGELVEGEDSLEKLLAELDVEGRSADAIGTAARHELASAGYYTAWLMRLEGATADEWKPEAERARQQFRLLAEQLKAIAGPEGRAAQENLEATIRLEQMDLSELIARPLPKNCPNCCKNLCQKKRKQFQSRCNNPSSGKPSQKEGPQDARREIQRSQSAGLNERGERGS
jgi:hypothetical protein